jgi:hypothetical protein
VPWNLAKKPLWDYLRKIWDSWKGRPGIFFGTVPVGTAEGSDGTVNTLAKFISSGDVNVIGDAVPLTSTNAVAANNSTNFLRLSGTLPAIPTQSVYGAVFTVTPTAVSNSSIQEGVARFTLNTGQSGASATHTIRVVNSNRNSGAGFNSAINAQASQAAGDVGVGVHAEALSGATRIGFLVSYAAGFGTSGIADVTETQGAAFYADFDGVGTPDLILGTGASGRTYQVTSGGFSTQSLGASILGNITLGLVLGSASPTSRSVLGEPGLGADIAGAALTVAGGIATGSAVCGSVLVKTSDAGVSSSTLQTLTTKLSIAQGGVDNYRAKVLTVTTGTTALSTTHHVIRADASSGNVTLNLPAIAASNRGVWYRIKRIDSTANTVTINRAGSDTIDGTTSLTIPYQYDEVDLVAPDTGVDWMVVGRASSISTMAAMEDSMFYASFVAA